MSDVAGYRRPHFNTQPPYLYPGYRSTIKRSPTRPLVLLAAYAFRSDRPGIRLRSTSGPAITISPHSTRAIRWASASSSRGGARRKRPAGARTRWSRSGRRTAAGRYPARVDDHDAPLDPEFHRLRPGTLTDADGNYRFLTIKPGAYPWRNHYNAWRPAHIHFSLFGLGVRARLVTQMYFPGDPLLPYDPMYNSVPDELARRRLIAEFDWERTIPDIALAYRFDIVLRGRDETPMATKRS